MENKIKYLKLSSFDDFFYLKESFDENEVYFKLMPKEHYLRVKKSGYLSPVGKVTRDENSYRGNWTIPNSNLKEWLKPIKYFGSPLQALLMKRAVDETETVLLHLRITKDNKVHNRDITNMFVKPSFKNYYGSFSSEKEYKINESFISGRIQDFELINTFNVPQKLSEYVAEPESVLNFIYNKGEIVYTEKKMTSIAWAFFKIIMKKIFTFDFKNF